MKSIRTTAAYVAALAGLFAFAVGATPKKTPPPVQHAYNIRLATIHPYATAGRRGDVVYAQIAVYVNQVRKGAAIWNGVCDDNACPNRAMKDASYNLGVATAVDTGPVQDGDNVTWSYEVVTSNHLPTVDQFEATTSALIVSTCQDPWPCAAFGANSVFNGWGFAACDGPLAVDMVTRSGAFLSAHASGGEWGFERRYTAPEAIRGCAKSDYQIVTIVRQTS